MNKHTCKAKQVDGKGWIYGNLVKTRVFRDYDDGSGIIQQIVDKWVDAIQVYNSNNGTNYHYKEIEVDPNTVCRYTGLKDKNGVEIFEEDILKLGLFTFKVIWLYDRYICMESIDGITKYELGYALQHKEATFDSNRFD